MMPVPGSTVPAAWLDGKMRQAMPGPLLQDRLTDLAAQLGPLPHARLNIEQGRDNRGPADREKKQGTRMLKAECTEESCTFVVRVAATPAREIGPPHCPKHGAMTVQWPEDGDSAPVSGSQTEAAESPSGAV